MLNCRNATRLMSEAQDRPLTLTEGLSLRLHIMMCSGCHNFKGQMDTLRLASRTYNGKESGAGKKNGQK